MKNHSTPNSFDTPALGVSIIVPAYNEGDVIADLVQATHTVMKGTGETYEIIVVDDGSSDDTAQAARQAGARVIRHPYNIGNGAAVKTGIRQAKGKVFVSMDGDGQHDPADIPRLLEQIGPFDMIVGMRTRQAETALHRDLANGLYNFLASYVSGRKIEDLTSGFRAVKTEIIRQFAYLLPNTFSYPTTLTLSVVRAGYSLGYIPIHLIRRPGKGKSKIRPWKDGLRFLLIILKISVFYAPLKVFIPLSLIMFFLGFGYGLFRIFTWHVRYGETSALLMSSAVLVFLVGLVSEQIAQLRFDRSESANGGTTENIDGTPLQ
jgi:glycosyltransferase involved in cell wall biosynthesis